MHFMFSCILINWLQFDSNSSFTFSRACLINKNDCFVLYTCPVETHFWLVNPDHVLAIWLLTSKVKFGPWIQFKNCDMKSFDGCRDNPSNTGSCKCILAMVAILKFWNTCMSLSHPLNKGSVLLCITYMYSVHVQCTCKSQIKVD